MALAISEIQKILAVDSVGYRFSRANPQRNSYVQQAAPGRLSVDERTLYQRFDENISTGPRYLLSDQNLTLVVGSEELLVFNQYGTPQVLQELHSRGTVYLGQEGYSWITPSGQLSVADINHDLRINRHSVPLFAGNCAIPLWHPFDGGFVAAVQDFGELFQPDATAMFYLYSMTYEKSLWNWIVELEGLVEDVFLTSDQTRAVIRQANKVQLYQLSDGKLMHEFELPCVRVTATVLSPVDELTIMGYETDGEVSKPALLCVDLLGVKQWGTSLLESEMQGFLAAGTEGFVVVSSNGQLRALDSEKELYLQQVESSIGSRFTLLGENQLLAVVGKSLELFTTDASKQTLCDLRDYDDKILTAPVIAPSGKVALGTDRSLLMLS